ncbi:6-phosphogluconate dehydrogenase C-terminal domain-like protein [Setomelanomma holmii]|uniref:2-dehydropantoate 2-reductase n=1 Tax=Setomelanomma holmii TaxID=210430 RepID=A0A9P4GZC5_9PLEO|nr:6-phosphogluconate dehydrogenase C-terminal domain-like protein [Setomelanomma holmii]
MQKKTVLIIGGGAVGAIAALNLEAGGLAEVTLVLRSNYKVVNEKGYSFESCDHGSIKAWKPSVVRNTIPDVKKESLPLYDYILLATKNIPDVPPTVVDLVTPALPSNNTHTTIVLLQNGLNIEKPFLSSHPKTPVLSGVSLIGSAEPSPGHIVHDEPDKLFIGAFSNPNISSSLAQSRAQDFFKIYSAASRTQCTYSPNVLHDRWRKLVYNACLNPICAITGLDSGRIRLAEGALNGLVRPAMREIICAAKAVGRVELDEGIVKWTIEMDPLESYLKPSMQQDLDKGNFIEFENLLGEPLREGKKAGVEMPTLEVLYQLAKAIQWRNKERRGMVDIPRKK